MLLLLFTYLIFQGQGKQGSVGDKIIQLYKPDGFISQPTLIIESKRGNFPDVRVIYED